MTFEEILDQALAMLQRRRRVTYTTLRLQFQLDDEQLAALKDELLYSQPHVIDDAGRGLVWTGDRDTTAPLFLAPTPPGADECSHGQTARGAPPSVALHVADAERRQLTVMFCDLVDSTRLSSQLDPEDLREVVRTYQSTCAEVIQRFDGHIAQLLGDGLLVYFGYPHAHEDDAYRAVRSGVEIVDAVRTLNARVESAHGIRLAVRVGIHTGLVVVGEMGGGDRQEQLALGETPNIAARLQGVAAPNTVLVSEATTRLTQGFFLCQALGAQEIKGLAQPFMVYQVLRESGAQTRFEVATNSGLAPLVGRIGEVTLLQERWAQAKEGLGQVVLLHGEPGIGKSRLVQALKDHLAGEPHFRWECRCSPYHQHSALYPLIDLLQRILRWQEHTTSLARLSQLEQALGYYRLSLAETVPLIAALLSLPLPDDRYPPLTLTPQQQKHKTLEVILCMLAEAYGHHGQLEDGLQVLTEALAVTERNGEASYEAEIHRLKGTFLLRQTIPDEHQAETCFHQALTLARQQQAKSWELRAAISLAHLWQQQGKGATARGLLVPIYSWFTEGFDTADLQEAKALLEALV